MKSSLILSIILILVGIVNCSSKKSEQLAGELYLSGKKSYIAKDFINAEKHFRDVLGINKYHNNARLMIAKIFFYENKLEDARLMTEEILEHDADNVGALYWHAKILLFLGNGNEEKARKNLSSILEIDSSHIGARSLLALVYEKENKFKEALDQYEMILDEEKQMIDARANLGILYKKIGVKAKAVEQITTAIQLAKLKKVNDTVLKKIKAEIEK